MVTDATQVNDIGFHFEVVGCGQHRGGCINASIAEVVISAWLAQVNRCGLDNPLHLVGRQIGINRPDQRSQARYVGSGQASAPPPPRRILPWHEADYTHPRCGDVHHIVVG